jgi:hypothetical protein
MLKRFFAFVFIIGMAAPAIADDKTAAQPGILRAAEVAWAHFSSQPPENSPCGMEDTRCYILSLGENNSPEEYFIRFELVKMGEKGAKHEDWRMYQISKQDFRILNLEQHFVRVRENRGEASSVELEQLEVLKTPDVPFPVSRENAAPVPGLVRAVGVAWRHLANELARNLPQGKPSSKQDFQALRRADIRNYVILEAVKEDAEYFVNFALLELPLDGRGFFYYIDKQDFRFLRMEAYR